MLAPVSNKTDFPALEREILAFWEIHETFRRSLEARKDASAYVFYDGPPFATGAPHYGHLLAGTIKDIVPRYQTMRGHYVERRFGWDCHGLPIEALAQEKLSLSGPAAIVETGIDAFNETCRSMVQTYVADWRKTVTRMGRWVDFDNDYKTMDLTFMESIWWVFKQLWDQGRVYKSYRIMPYSWKLSTPLSNFEAGRNYQDVQDPAITVRAQLVDPSPDWAGGRPCYLLIWTTTPWTLPGNLAICAGPDIDYVAVRDRAEDVIYVMAEARLSAYYEDEKTFERLAAFKGAELLGLRYRPLFPYFANRLNAFKVLNDAFVTTEDGTGLVHIAPAFGEDDFRVARAAGIELADYLDEQCAFTSAIPEYAGQFCKDADKAIIRRLKDEGQLVHQTTLQHSYPFCDRTDTPLIYRAIEAWYVRVEDLRDRLVALNETVHWVPDYVGDKRFGNWLKEAKDWNISRNRFWGSCIPVWVSEDGQDTICVGSIDELEALSGQRVTDLHKHVVDRIEFEHNGKRYRRTPEVLDCWFESGAMPYAQQHYPFERKDELERIFPAQFIAEGLDQTRGWFYTLMVLSTALFDASAYRNVVVNGLVLAADGRKMSKRLKNYPDPNDILEAHGADALRLYMIHSPVVRAENLCFTEEGVKHALRHLLIPWWNAYAFFVTYARVDGWQPGPDMPDPRKGDALDRWILSALDRLTGEVVEAMDRYDLQQAVRPFVQFVEELTNWYIRRSRRRFWKSTDDADKAHAYATLYTVLVRLSQIAAPFVPFITEAIYRNLRTDDMPESVHLCDFPVSDGTGRDPELEQRMEWVMAVVGMGRQLRADFNAKVRQPLAALHIITRDASKRESLKALSEIISDELNVKAIRFEADETELADLSAKPNFQRLGPKLGAQVKQAAATVRALGPDALAALLRGEHVDVALGDGTLTLTPKDVIVERRPKEGMAVASEGDLVVALDLTPTPALLREGLAREFVNRVQNLRKAADLEVTQRIRLTVDAPEPVREALEAHLAYVRGETLCTELTFGPVAGAEAETLNEHPCGIRLTAT